MKRGLATVSGAQGIALVCGAITNLLYARLLAPQAIGLVAIVSALALAGMIVADLGFQLTLTRKLARSSIGPNECWSFLIAQLPVLGTIWIAAWCIALPLAPKVATPRVALLTLELGASLWLFQSTLTILQGTGAYSRRGAAVALNGALTALCTAIALEVEPTATWAIHATASAYVIAALLAIPASSVRGIRILSIPEISELVRESRLVWANSTVTFLTSSGDVFLAATLLPLAAVGYYQVTKKLALVVFAPITALLPVIYSQLARVDRERRDEIIADALKLTCFGGLAAVLLTSTFGASVIPTALGGRYGAITLAVVAALGSATVQFSHNLLGYSMTAVGEYWKPLALNATVACASVIAACLLAPSFDLDGFVIALLLGNLVGLVTAGLLSGYRRSAGSIGAAIGSAVVIGGLFLRLGSLSRLALGGGLLTACIVTLLLRSLISARPSLAQPSTDYR